MAPHEERPERPSEAPGMPPGWYDDPRGGRQYWDGRQWRSDVSPQRPPRRGQGLAVALVVVIAIAGAAVVWTTGALDETLADAGLSFETCAENLFGKTLCGDDLVRFCEATYNPEVNAETCDPVLRDAGVDVEALVAKQRDEEREEQAALEKRLYGEKTRETGSFGNGLELRAPPEDLMVTVDVRRTDFTVGDYDEPSSGRTYVAIDVEVENLGDATAELSPASGLTVIDDAGRQARPAIVLGGDCPQDAMSDLRLAPGDARRGCVVFEIADDAEVARVQLSIEGSDGTDEALGEWQ